MMTVDTKEHIARLILGIAREEKGVEVARQILAEQSLFEPYAAFQRIDRCSKGILIGSDLLHFLHNNGIKTEEYQIPTLFHFYDRDLDGKLSFKEFMRIILPLANSELRAKTVQRSTYEVSQKSVLPNDVEFALARVLQRELEALSTSEKMRVCLLFRHDFKVLDAFRLMDIHQENFIHFEGLLNFLKKYGKVAHEEDAMAFIRRFDWDGDCQLNYIEFSEGIVSARQRPSYSTPTKSSIKRTIVTLKKLSPPRFTKWIPSTSKHTNKSIMETPNRPKSTLRYRTSLSTAKKAIISKNFTRNPSPFSLPPNSNGIDIVFFLAEQARMEKSLESLKLDLVAQPDVTLPLLLLLFDPRHHCSLQLYDLVEALDSSLNMGQLVEESKLLLNRFDRDFHGVLRYEDLRKMVVPFDESSADALLEKKVSSSLALSEGSLNKVRALVQRYIETETEMNELKVQLSHATPQKSFNQLDSKHKGYLTIEDLEQAFLQSKYVVTSPEIVLLFSKYDKDKDAKISYSEFLKEVV